MKLGLQYGTRYIEFDVVFKARKTMEISVEPPDIVTVIAPIETEEDKIIEIVRTKCNWIIQKIFHFNNMQYKKIDREFVNGESFMYLGRNYSLQIIIDNNIKKSEVKLYRGKFHITLKEKSDKAIKDAMENWYRAKAKEHIENRVKYYQRFFSKKPTVIKIKEQKRRWGSCTFKDELLFNWRCIMARSHALDYIIVHEMCHLYHKNHSKEYWELVASIMPDYKVRKEWLKNYGVRMDL